MRSSARVLAMAPITSPAALFTEAELLTGQVQAKDLITGYISTFAVKAACLLRIPDILAAHGPLTLQAIASRLSSNSPNTDYLYRLLRFLCAKGVFSLNLANNSDGVPEPTYGLTPVSASLLLHDESDVSFAPMALLAVSAEVQASWQCLPDCILHGGVPFESVNGMDIWSYLKLNPDYNRIFNDAMARTVPYKVKALWEHYHGFEKLKTLVDLGGGTGEFVSQIVARYPNIKAINFDLPHVVAKAPSFPGVEHIGGDMFDSIPAAEAILMMTILHDWDDDHCIKILKNCAKALPKSGKLIIVERVVDTDVEKPNPANQVAVAAVDLTMLVLLSGKERSRKEWEALLAATGFPTYTITELYRSFHVIEAFPVQSP